MLIINFLTTCQKPFPWGNDRSIIVGLSCLLFLLPAYAVRHQHPYESFLWYIVTLLSFLSDYAFCGRRDTRYVRMLHLTDRWFASGTTLLQATVNLSRWYRLSLSLGVLGTLLTVTACITKLAGYSAKSRSDWEVRHSLWHVAGSGSRTLMALMEGHDQ